MLDHERASEFHGALRSHQSLICGEDRHTHTHIHTYTHTLSLSLSFSLCDSKIGNQPTNTHAHTQSRPDSSPALVLFLVPEKLRIHVRNARLALGKRGPLAMWLRTSSGLVWSYSDEACCGGKAEGVSGRAVWLCTFKLAHLLLCCFAWNRVERTF